VRRNRPLPGRPRRATPPRGYERAFLWSLVPALLAVAGACGDPVLSPPDPSPVETVLALTGDGQRFWSGTRSPAPFRVRALDAAGDPVPGTPVAFTLEEGEREGHEPGGGILSQPTALTDERGEAESFLLDARSGTGRVKASAGAGSVEFTFHVDLAPGSIVVGEAAGGGSGAVGLPFMPHPDSVVEVLLLDTEGRPLPGFPLWFASGGELSTFVDTTDAGGRARTLLRRSGPEAGENPVFAFVVGFPDAFAVIPRPVRRAAERVVLISVEGLRGDASALYSPPNLTRLAREGASTATASSVSPTLTVPAHLSILAGVPPTEHGVVQDRLTLTQEMASLDPLFRRARSRGFAGSAVLSRDGPLAAFGEVLECRQAFGLDALTLVGPSAAATWEAAREELLDPEVALLFLHFPDPDLAGHRYGWLSPEYREAVLEVDRVLGEVLTLVDAVPERRTLLVVTSPHGGGGAYGPFQHGSDAPEDRLVPLLLRGGSVAPGTTLHPTTLLDVAPTILWALGVQPPPHYRGRRLLEGFQPFPSID